MVELQWKEFRILVDYIGHKNWSCDSKFTNYNYHKVHIRNLNTKKATYFEYWSSNAHPIVESDKDILEAVQCFLNDSIAGKMDYPEFCAEFGYPEFKENGYPDANSKRIWKACKNSLAKFERVFEGYEVEDIYNQIQEEIENDTSGED